jgi:hypothetical protein
LIRANLEVLASSKRPKRIEIGDLSDEQLSQINDFRRENGFPAIIARVVFIGRHLYQSRIVENGYTIDEVLEQIENAMKPCAVVRVSELRTSLQNPERRIDKYGNSVSDRAVLECTAFHPHPELFSVTPIGDVRRPNKAQKVTRK